MDRPAHLQKRFFPDTVTLIKQDGKTVGDFMASVQSRQIFIPQQGQESLPLIESGDIIQRMMSNGGKDVYEVIDPNFQEGSSRYFEPIYEMTVRKLGIPQAKSPIQNIAIGPNARINQDTVDQSNNIVQLSSDVAKILENLRQEINQCIEGQSQRSETLKVVDTIAEQFNSGSPNRIVVDALVKVLPHAGNIASIASLLQTYLGG